jgi:hypothetical protein
MRTALCLLLVLFYACQSPSSSSSADKSKLTELLEGNWLILYPNRTYGDSQPREVYNRLYDSLVARTGLRLVQFNDDGSFIQPDSLNAGGRWVATPNNKIILERGGKGLDDFKGDFQSFEDSVLTIVEYIRLKDETLEMTWKLKKIGNDKLASSLLKRNNNEWRMKPKELESEEEIRERLAEMLKYYANYCKLLSRESRIFIPARFIVPVDFYQDAMGLKSFDSTKAFAKMFYNVGQAKEAHYYLDRVFSRLTGKYPSGNDYMEEYGVFMEMMAMEVQKD